MRFPQNNTGVPGVEPRPDMAGLAGTPAVRPVVPRSAPPQIRQHIAPQPVPPAKREADTRKSAADRRISEERRDHTQTTPLDTRIKERRRRNRRQGDHGKLPLDELV